MGAKQYNDFYTIEKEIGKGKYCTIYKAILKDNNEKRAIKIIYKNTIRDDLASKFTRKPNEELIEKYIKNYRDEFNINKTFEGDKNALQYYEFYDSQNEFAIVMELCDENLLNYIVRKHSINENHNILIQLNRILNIVVEKKHPLNFINLEDILLKYENEEKSQFIVKLKIKNNKSDINDLYKFQSSINYNKSIFYSPEYLKEQKYTEKSDLWNLGVIIYILYNKEYPFKKESEDDSIRESESDSQILERMDYNIVKKNEDFDLNDLIEGLLNTNPIKRMSWEKYFNHQFFIKKDFRDYYEIENQIGNTEFVVVYRGKNKRNNELRAIKVLDYKRIKDDFRRKNLKDIKEEFNKYYNDFYNEINLMKILNSTENKNVVKFYEYFHKDNEISIIMELCDYNLLNILDNKSIKSFNSQEIYYILKQLNNSLALMKERKIIHRSINLENILIKYTDSSKRDYIVKLKLTEVSILSKDLSENLNFDKKKANIKYISPEILKGEKYNEKCDLWSLGISIYTLYFGNPPFDGGGESEILKNIENIAKKTDSDSLDKLIQGLLKPDPEKRLNWDDYLNHEFFNQSILEDFRKYYEIEKEIGTTKFATVYKGKKKDTKELIGIKIFEKIRIEKYYQRVFKQLTFNYMKYFYNEINNTKKLENNYNENILKIYQLFDNKNEISIIMELCDCSLLTLKIEKEEKQLHFNNEEIFNILSQLNNSFTIMNEKQIVHRALNLENILIKYKDKEKEDYTVKLKLTEDSISLKDLKENLEFDKTANFKYIAPEILKGEEYNEKCDLWSLGVIIYILSFGEFPFNANNESEILKVIEKIGENIIIKTENKFLDNLISQLLNPNPKKRLNWTQYFEHDFFKQNIFKNFRELYINLEEIGNTGYAVVYKGVNKNNNETRAIKIFGYNKVRIEFRREKFREITNEEMKTFIKRFFNEINNMKIMTENTNDKNNNIVNYIEHYKNNEEIVVIMELCDNNLLNVLVTRSDAFSSEEIYSILNQLNNSFKIMNEKKLVHRALNLENILIKYKDKEKQKYIVKLKLTEDSILLKDLDNNKEFNIEKHNLKYIAPEILRGQIYDEKCDLWSLGIIIYILCFKESPFKSKSKSSILEEINKFGNYEQFNTKDPNLSDLLKCLLNPDPQKRFNWNDYFDHNFFKRRKKNIKNK